MISNDVQRLLRQSWQSGDIDQFVLELVTLLSSSSAVNHTGQLVLTQSNNLPALVIQNNSGDGNRVIQFLDGSGADLGGITVGGVHKIGGPGGITVGATDQGPIAVGRNDLTAAAYAAKPPPTTAGGSNTGPLVIDWSKGHGFTVAASLGQPASAGGGGVPCLVGSKQSGSTYNCSVYPNGITAASVAALVQQLQIDSTDTIPSGTWTEASLGGDGKYTMQVPTWA